MSTALPAIVNALCPVAAAQSAGAEAFAAIRRDVPGWSHPFHYTFFSTVLGALPSPARVCVCGVYRGLDLALLTEAARRQSHALALTGVDLFADAPCADWTPEMRDRGTWAGNGIGLPPSQEAAQRAAPAASLVRASSIDYLAAHAHEFEFIYLDTAHDEATVRAEISAVRTALTRHPRPLLLGGDDYYEPGTHWGVDRAVQALIPNHVVFFGRIWLAAL